MNEPAPLEQSAGRREASARQWAQSEDILDEIEDFLDADVHPLLIAQVMRRTHGGIYKLAFNHGRERVQKAFAAVRRDS